ncbi:MAG: hypothetical protein BJ554DRAFT_7947, partial [Olpidium bornovanus]
EGNKILFRVALSLFKIHEDAILALKNPLDVFQFVQNMPKKMLDCDSLVEGVDYLLDVQRSLQIVLVAEDQNRDPGQLRLLQQGMQFYLGRLKLGRVRRVHYVPVFRTDPAGKSSWGTRTKKKKKNAAGAQPGASAVYFPCKEAARDQKRGLATSAEARGRARARVYPRPRPAGRRRREPNLHDGVHPPTVPLPHAPEPGLAADVPELDHAVADGDLPHVETDGRDHVLAELAGLGSEGPADVTGLPFYSLKKKKKKKKKHSRPVYSGNDGAAMGAGGRFRSAVPLTRETRAVWRTALSTGEGILPLSFSSSADPSRPLSALAAHFPPVPSALPVSSTGREGKQRGGGGSRLTRRREAGGTVRRGAVCVRKRGARVFGARGAAFCSGGKREEKKKKKKKTKYRGREGARERRRREQISKESEREREREQERKRKRERERGGPGGSTLRFTAPPPRTGIRRGGGAGGAGRFSHRRGGAPK